MPILEARSALYGKGDKPFKAQPKPGIEYAITAYEGRETVRTITQGQQPAVIDVHFSATPQPRDYGQAITHGTFNPRRGTFDELLEHVEAESMRIKAKYGMTDEQLDKMTFGELNDLIWQEKQRGL